MEAVSAQVAALRRGFPRSVAWGLHPSLGMQLSWQNGIVVNPRYWFPFRGATSVLQWAFQINHIFGGIGDWYYLRASIKQPIVLTAAVRAIPCDLGLLRKVAQFVVEWPHDKDYLAELGVNHERIRVIPPPVDLARFQAAPKASEPFTAVFASSPERADELADRGLDLLLDTAALRPEYRFLLVWRPWGTSEARVREWIAGRRLTNVSLLVGRQACMEDIFCRAHVAMAPFRNPLTTKSVPNSLLESLACGRPIITSHTVSLGRDVEAAGGGKSVEPDAGAMVAALDELRSRWEVASACARRFAEENFSQSRYLDAHRAMYEQLLAS